jgi:hypothetical protein
VKYRNGFDKEAQFGGRGNLVRAHEMRNTCAYGVCCDPYDNAQAKHLETVRPPSSRANPRSRRADDEQDHQAERAGRDKAADRGPWK